MTLSDIQSVSFSDLMSTVASHFGLNTGSAEREAETACIDIHNALFLVSNVQGVEFSVSQVSPLKSRILLIVFRTLLTLLLVLTLPLPQSISAFPHHLYPFNFLSVYLNPLVILPLVLL